MRTAITDERHCELLSTAKRVRRHIIETAAKARGIRGAHYGPSLSCVEIITTLYFCVMRYDAGNPEDERRDRFIISKNHAGLALYSALAEFGLITKDELESYHLDGSDLFGYPRNLKTGMEFEGGSLGMGLSYGIGQALAARLKGLDFRAFVLLGDGELNEGSVWEAFMAAPHFKLGNITAIIDRNRYSIDGETENIMALEPLDKKLSSFGWHVISCDGHDFKGLADAFSHMADDRPTAVIANTVKGKGISFMENRREWHQARMSAEQLEQALAETGGDI